MSAPILQSTNNSGWVAANNTTVTKPTGLSVGDLMIGRVSADNSSTAITGFTSLGDSFDGSTTIYTQISYKFADSSDVAASTFAATTGGTQIFASVSRVTGYLSADGIVYGEGTTTNNATPSVAAGVTPVNHGESVLLMMFPTGVTSVTSVASYAIATSDPTWTEGYDATTGGNRVASMASATRTQVTATGNTSCAGGDATTDWSIQLISISSSWQTAVSESITLTETLKSSPSTNISESTTLTDSSTSRAYFAVTNQSKNSSSITNLAKS